MKKYDTYKDSGIQWIGQVPEHWAITRIKFLANAQENSFADGDWIESPYVTDSGIRYLTSGNIGNGSFKRQGNGYITEETFQKLNCKFAYPGDLVFCRLNQPFGRSCILPNDQDRYVIAVDNVILRTNEDKRYICYITQLERYQNYIGMQANGTAMQRISRTKLGNVYIPLPPLSEQQAIADFLDKKTGEIDKAIALFEQEKIDLQSYRKAIISETVTKGLNPNAKLKDSGIQWIGQIPEEWSVRRIKDKYILQTGTTPKGYDSQEESGELINWFTPADITESGNLLKDSLRKISRQVVEDNSISLYPKGSLIFVGIGATAGKLGFAEVEGYSNQQITALIPKDGVQSKYHFYYLMSVKNVLRDTASYTTMPIINNAFLSKEYLPLPPISEQEAIVAFLDKKTSAIDTAIERINAQITELQTYRTALISEAVTGKIDVR
ncbi:MAG: restriction endonuclease subunit S [Paludibacteraceae bacterium]|nr:restriction endonuclease subunit S [Paludibacteraceae bacterium]